MPHQTGLIIHGTPNKEEYLRPEAKCESVKHWIPWLAKRMIDGGVFTQAPEMPEPYLPHYDAWERVARLFPTQDDSILVGHSCGGGFLLRLVSEQKTRLKHLVLVAPWLDPFHEKDPSFFEFVLDPDLAHRMKVSLLESDNDSEAVKASIQTIKDRVPGIHVHSFHEYGHFCFDDLGGEEFPELLEIVLEG